MSFLHEKCDPDHYHRLEENRKPNIIPKNDKPTPHSNIPSLARNSDPRSRRPSSTVLVPRTCTGISRQVVREQALLVQ